MCNKFVTICTYVMLPAAALAADYTWSTTNSSGSYTAATNWSPSSPAGGPGSGDKVIFGDTTNSGTLMLLDTNATVADWSSSTSVFYRMQAAAGASRSLAITGTLTKAGANVLDMVGNGTDLLSLTIGTLSLQAGTMTVGNSVLGRFSSFGVTTADLSGTLALAGTNGGTASIGTLNMNTGSAALVLLNAGSAGQTFTVNVGALNGSVGEIRANNNTGSVVTTLAVTGNVTSSYGGGIVNGGAGNTMGLLKSGTGTLTLSAANSYSGGTTLSNGVLRLEHANAAGTGLITQSSGSSTLQINTTGSVANAMSIYNIQTLQTVTLSGNKTLNNATYDVTNGTTTTESGVLSGGGGITKLGTGTLLVTASNAYTGGTTISAGTLLFTNGGSVAGNITNNATLSINRTDTATLSNTVSGTGAMTKTGAGTLTLTGNNTYAGATTVAGGTLRIDGNSRLGNTTNTLTISNAGVLEVTAAGTLTNAMTIGAGNGVLLNTSSGALVVAGNVSKDGTVFTSRAGSGTNIFTGVISGASANSDFVVDGGTTVFSNVMTYNGPTIVLNGGTLNLGTNNAIPTGSALRLGTNATAGTVNLQGNNQTVASLETQGTAGTNNLVTLGGGTLTIDGGGSTTYAGAISGNGTVQKSGAGTITLSGSVTATNLRISAGAVALGADNVLGNTLNLDLNGGTFIVGSGGTRYTDTLGTLTLSASSTIDMGATGGLGTITFANSSVVLWATNAVLTITNWQGVASQQSEVTKLLFGTGGLTSTQLAQIRFADQNIDGGQLLGAQGELAPIPEAPVVWGAAALAAFIVLRERRRFLLLGRLSASLALPALGWRRPRWPVLLPTCAGVHAQPQPQRRQALHRLARHDHLRRQLWHQLGDQRGPHHHQLARRGQPDERRDQAVLRHR